jgi:hypothetical protein
MSAWIRSVEGFADALCGLREPSFPAPICYKILSMRDPASLPGSPLSAALDALLVHLSFVSRDHLPSAGACWSRFLCAALHRGLGRNFRLEGLQLANTFLTAGDHERGFAIFSACLARPPWNLTEDESDLAACIILSRLEMAVTAPCWIEFMLKGMAKLWVLLAMDLNGTGHAIIVSREHGDLTPIIIEWVYAMLNAALTPGIAPLFADIAAYIASGFGEFCKTVRGFFLSNKDFVAVHENQLFNLTFQLVLQNPNHRRLYQAFINNVLPAQACPVNFLPPLISQMLHMSLLNEDHVNLAEENAMDYWWQVFEPEQEDVDSHPRASSLRQFEFQTREALVDVQNIFLEQIENIGSDWRELEVVLRYITILIRSSEDPRLVQTAVELIRIATRENEVNWFPIACGWRYLLASLVIRTRDS